MATKSASSKTACTNPNTGNSILIDTDIYSLFQKAIYHTVKAAPGINFSEMANGVKKCFQKEKVKFTKSIQWYTVVVKQDMEVKKIIAAKNEKGKKRHYLIK
jgi:hypothetical protein